jgi:hypothetical protein
MPFAFMGSACVFRPPATLAVEPCLSRRRRGPLA